MKTLISITYPSSEFGKRTGYQAWRTPAYVTDSDGARHFFDSKQLPDGKGTTFEDLAYAYCAANGIDATEYKRKRAEWEKAHSYPPKPKSAELYQHNYGHEKPVKLGEWQWSTTFGRWGRIVTFADGWHGFTYPHFSQSETANA